MRPAENARYLDLFNRMLDFVFIVDGETYQILDANPAAEMGLNLSREELLEKKFSEWIQQPNLQEIERHFRIAKRNYYPKRFTSTWSLAPHQIAYFEVIICLLQVGEADESSNFQLIARNITKEVETQKELDRYIHQLEALSTQDGLTQLANIRHFKDQLQIEHNRAQRYSDHYCIVLFDVDHFKNYNDRNGHPAGDELLRNLAKILQENIRNTDLAARYGGEEFVILLRSTPFEGGWTFAERIRKVIEEHPFDFGEFQPLGKLSISVGVAEFPHSGKSIKNLIEAADQALYQSKRNGRNQTTTAPAMKLETDTEQ